MKFRYDGLGTSLERQARRKGYTLGPDAERVETARLAVFTLMFHNILDDKQVEEAWAKLDKKVRSRLEKVDLGEEDNNGY